MNSISIQGAHTSSFQFRNNSGQEFRSLVESLVLNSATLICSNHRIDLLYKGDFDRQEDIMRAWCKTVGKDFTSAVKQKFIRMRGREETLEHYFVSLIYLARIPDWLHEYSTELNIVLHQEPNHPIHKEIVGCAIHLAKQKDFIHLPLDESDKYSIAHHLIKNINQFAKDAALGYLNN